MRTLLVRDRRGFQATEARRARGGFGESETCARRGAVSTVRIGSRAARARARAGSRGFTLIELMVVVVLVAILAMLAVPSMAAAREDRLAFRTADGFAHLIHNARMNAMARGAAQLVAITSNGTTDRGTVLVFETLDAGGRPQSTCKMPNQWAGVPVGSTTNPILAGDNLNGAANSMVVKAGLETTLADTGAAVKAFVVCFTPGGRVYAASNATLGGAIAALPTAQPYTGDLSFAVVRKPNGATTPIGLSRNVIMTAAGGTRIQSQ